MKITAVTQSNYIPWKGYFDIIQVCDEVIFLDDVQYTRRDWRNRNQIKTAGGPKWLTVPVDVKGKYADLRICDVEIKENVWALDHWDLIAQNYKKAPHFKEIEALLKPVYEEAKTLTKLSDVNFLFIKTISDYLEFQTKFSKSYDYFTLEELDDFSSTQRLAKLCEASETTDYISGPAAKDYMEVNVFEDLNINVHWANYIDYPEYTQLHGDFTHYVSVIDLLMMEGASAAGFFKAKKILEPF